MSNTAKIPQANKLQQKHYISISFFKSVMVINAAAADFGIVTVVVVVVVIVVTTCPFDGN